MVPSEDNPAWEAGRLYDCLEVFVRGAEAAASAVPWAARLSPVERERLRTELEMILSEPELSGEPVDWREIHEILREWAEAAGWKGALIQPDGQALRGPYSVELRPRDAAALIQA